MPDDEPLDDVRAVATAGAAAAARIVETAARAGQDRRERQTPTERPYDSPERRQQTDAAMRTAQVPDEPRTARSTADLMNGADPQTAAAAGTKTRARAPRKQAAPEQVRSR
jgi:hypothetical protein